MIHTELYRLNKSVELYSVAILKCTAERLHHQQIHMCVDVCFVAAMTTLHTGNCTVFAGKFYVN